MKAYLSIICKQNFHLINIWRCGDRWRYAGALVWETAMRRIGVVAYALVALSASPAAAECTPLGVEMSGVYIDALSARMKKDGPFAIESAQIDAEGNLLFIMQPLRQTVILFRKNGVVVEYGTVAGLTTDDNRLRREFEIVAFTLARSGLTTEGEVLDRLLAGVAAHKEAGEWAERFGLATAVMTRTQDRLIARFGVQACK